MNIRLCAVSPEPSPFAWTRYWRKWRFSPNSESMTTHMRYRVPRACTNIYFSNEHRASMQSNMSNSLHLFFYGPGSWSELKQWWPNYSIIMRYASLSQRIGGNREGSEQSMNVDRKSLEFTICHSQANKLQSKKSVSTPDSEQSKTLFTIDERG